jgi:hypothetical protein
MEVERLRPQPHRQRRLRVSAVRDLQERDRWTFHVQVRDAVRAVLDPCPHPCQRVSGQRITDQQLGSRHREITEPGQHARERVTFGRPALQPLVEQEEQESARNHRPRPGHIRRSRRRRSGRYPSGRPGATVVR